MLNQKILFTENDCKKILKLVLPENKMDGQKNYGHNSLEVSFDEYKIYDNNFNKWFLDVIKNYICSNVKLDIDKLNIDAHILKYNINDGFSKHRDLDSYAKNPRILTVGVLLNDNFDGGDLIIYDNNENKFFLEKVIGNCYFFDSTVFHEVEKIKSGTRFSLIIHIRNSEIKKNRLL